jgi:hypothetical protein
MASSPSTACDYLAALEKVYRFSPFSKHACPRTRGTCPLEVVGYEVHKRPKARLFLAWRSSGPRPSLRSLAPMCDAP